MLKKIVFTAQMDAYIKTQTILAVVMVLIQLFARVIINYSPFLACDLHGKAWLQIEFIGSFFIIFHMMCICMQSVMIMKVHFLIPRKLNYFDLEAKSEMKQSEEAEMEKLLEKEDA